MLAIASASSGVASRTAITAGLFVGLSDGDGNGGSV
jgi:hypothetical protein